MKNENSQRRCGPTAPRRTARKALLALLGAPLLILGWTAVAGATAPSGPVTVLSAGSLEDLIQQQIAPAFIEATGYTLNDTSMGSAALAAGIKGGTLQGDVFISASPAINATLEGAGNGNWVKWYAEFASSTLVLGYNPSSTFAAALKSKPWYEVIDQPGFRIGRTDPTTDPKGVLVESALNQAAKRHDLPALATLATTTSDEFPEESLIGQLQSGQLDAGFFYRVEAAAAKIKTVPLTGTKLAGMYTITILNKAPDPVAARAFLKYLLSAAGERILNRNGIVPISSLKISGKSSVPRSVMVILSR